MVAPLQLDARHFLLIGSLISVITLVTQAGKRPATVRHEARHDGRLISQPSLLYLAVTFLLNVLSCAGAAAVASLTLMHIAAGQFYPLQSAVCVGGVIVTNRLIRRGLSQQVFSTPEGLFVEQWNHSIYLPWDATEGQWNLKAGRWPFYGVIQRRGTAPLLLRRYRLSVCLNEETTRAPRMLRKPGPIIDVTARD